MRRVVAGLLIGSVGLLGACETARRVQEAPTQTPQEAASSLLSEIYEARERRPDDRVRLRDGDAAEGADEGLPEAVAAEWSALQRGLFGEYQPALKGGLATAEVARFDADSGEVIFSGNPQGESEAAFALALAVNEAIEHFAFDALLAPESVDQWFAREILRQAGPAFVSTSFIAKREGIDVSAAELGLRPEMAVAIPSVRPHLHEESVEEVVGIEYFEAARRRLLFREALALGAALHRSGGWSAVEWGRIEPPTTTNQALRPDRWLAGDGEGEWTWPERYVDHREEQGWTLETEGLVGPALTALWLESVVDPRAVRTVYSGYLTDEFRMYSREEDEQRGFAWVSAWQTPHEAQEIAMAAEGALLHFFGAEVRDRRFRVATRGVNVAVITYDADQDQTLLNQEVEVLTEATFRLLPEEAKPIDFVPTLYERYVVSAAEGVLDDEEWTDPASGFKASIEALGQWNLQKSDEAHVRWFGTHDDGALIQWTTELLNPLEASFGSPAYIDALRETFAASVRSEEPPRIELGDSPVDPTVELEVVGMIEGRNLALRLWQWHRGDVLVSFSIQGPVETFGDRLSEAEGVLQTVEEYGEPVTSVRRAAAADDEGIIEFRVEED